MIVGDKSLFQKETTGLLIDLIASRAAIFIYSFFLFIEYLLNEKNLFFQILISAKTA